MKAVYNKAMCVRATHWHMCLKWTPKWYQNGPTHHTPHMHTTHHTRTPLTAANILFEQQLHMIDYHTQTTHNTPLTAATILFEQQLHMIDYE